MAKKNDLLDRLTKIVSFVIAISAIFSTYMHISEKVAVLTIQQQMMQNQLDRIEQNTRK